MPTRSTAFCCRLESRTCFKSDQAVWIAMGPVLLSYRGGRPGRTQLRAAASWHAAIGGARSPRAAQAGRWMSASILPIQSPNSAAEGRVAGVGRDADSGRELMRRVVGWKLVSEPSGLRLRGEWRVRDEESGGELMRRMGAVVEGQQEQCGGAQQADMSVEQGYVVRVDLHTPAIGGLSENDFIIAAKMDLVKVSALTDEPVFAPLPTSSPSRFSLPAGGLSENDFIIAAKMDLVKVSDLIKKARFWA
ncbi:unnamed protein product [Closterium sp. NIES-64]|nr:unnamed protein product [Closterium sp. NIES-64]